MTELGQPSHDEELNADMERCRAFIRSCKRGIVKSHPNLEVFAECDHAAELRALSKGMTISEICDFYGIHFDDLPENDKFFFCTMFLKGRTHGVYDATAKLFTQMSGKEGMKASIAYLSRFAENWKGEGKEGPAEMGKHLRIEIME